MKRMFKLLNKLGIIAHINRAVAMQKNLQAQKNAASLCNANISNNTTQPNRKKFLIESDTFFTIHDDRKYEHLFHMACYLVKNEEVEVAYALFKIAIAHLKRNALFIEFFGLVRNNLSLDQMREISKFFIVDNNILTYRYWLENNPYLLSCIAESSPHLPHELVELVGLKVVNKNAPRTIICFASRRPGGIHCLFNDLSFQFVDMLSAYDCNVIFVRDMHDAWYLKGLMHLTENVFQTYTFLKEKISDLHVSYKIGNSLTSSSSVNNEHEVYTIGSSAGGYAALLFGNLLAARRMVCFSPQTLLPRPAPFPDTELLRDVEPTYFDLLSALDWQGLRSAIHIFYSAEYPNDVSACERMRIINGAHLYAFPSGKNHNIAGWLKTKGLLVSEIRRCFS